MSMTVGLGDVIVMDAVIICTGIVALALFVYLFYVLFRGEKL